MLSKNHSENSCFGFCRECDREHSLQAGNAVELARDLMRDFEKHQRLDFTVPESDADPRVAFAQLFPR